MTLKHCPFCGNEDQEGFFIKQVQHTARIICTCGAEVQFILHPAGVTVEELYNTRAEPERTKALNIAIEYLHRGDHSDFGYALWEIVRVLGGEDTVNSVMDSLGL